jgi:hypothetical protein
VTITQASVLAPRVTNGAFLWQVAERIRSERDAARKDWRREYPTAPRMLDRLADEFEGLGTENFSACTAWEILSVLFDSDHPRLGEHAVGYLSLLGTPGCESSDPLQEFLLALTRDLIAWGQGHQRRLHLREEDEPQRLRARMEEEQEMAELRSQEQQIREQYTTLYTLHEQCAPTAERREAQIELLRQRAEKAEAQIATAEKEAERQKERAAKASKQRKEAQEASHEAWRRVRALEGKPEEET